MTSNQWVSLDKPLGQLCHLRKKNVILLDVASFGQDLNSSVSADSKSMTSHIMTFTIGLHALLCGAEVDPSVTRSYFHRLYIPLTVNVVK
jgi:hypothetical protein